MAEQIETAGIAEIGVDLYIGSIPADVGKGIMLIDPLTGYDFDDGLGGFVSGSFQAIVRDPDPIAAFDRAMAISSALRLERVGNNDVTIVWCRPMSLPTTYPRGDADDIETSVRFRIGYALK